MKLQQLRYLTEVARRNLNVSEAAEALFTSQPGVSKQIRLLEDELGVIVFERSGKRLTAITPPGEAVLAAAQRVLREVDNLRRIGEEFSAGDSGTLTIAATHTQARYALPGVIRSFAARHPNIRLHLHQGSPAQIADWVSEGEADLGVATEALDGRAELLALPCQQWRHCAVVPVGHPLAEGPLTLPALAAWPLVTYDPAYAGRSRIDEAFQRAGLTPRIALEAADADIIKTYVALGLGVGIIAGLAFDAQRDDGLAAIEAGHLFGANTTRIAVRRGTFQRHYVFDFIELFAPHLPRSAVEQALAGGGEAYQL
jgi:LysR family cys regulon transcriptional activator